MIRHAIAGLVQAEYTTTGGLLITVRGRRRGIDRDDVADLFEVFRPFTDPAARVLHVVDQENQAFRLETTASGAMRLLLAGLGPPIDPNCLDEDLIILRVDRWDAPDLLEVMRTLMPPPPPPTVTTPKEPPCPI